MLRRTALDSGSGVAVVPLFFAAGGVVVSALGAGLVVTLLVGGVLEVAGPGAGPSTLTALPGIVAAVLWPLADMLALISALVMGGTFSPGVDFSIEGGGFEVAGCTDLGSFDVSGAGEEGVGEVFPATCPAPAGSMV